MGLSKVDLWYRKLILTKFYTRGWGKPEVLKDILKMHKLISSRDSCYKLVSPDYPVHIDGMTNLKQCSLLRGSFVTPLMDIMPSLVPPAAVKAQFEVVLPKYQLPSSGLTGSSKINPACIHMAGTGDHGYHRRRELLAKPLLNCGITSVLLENPFYGSRKPKEQWRSGLLHVNDLFVMGGCLILEALVLLHWLKRMGYGPLGITGISMGGQMASLAATNWPEPLAIIPCMSWTSASVVWTEGVLSKAINWRVLEAQYSKDPRFEMEIMKLLSQVDSYRFGKNFISDKSDDHAVDSEPKETSFAGKAAEERRQQETVKFMRGVMDEITHLGNFSKPVDPTVVTFVIAKGDAYFPQSSLEPMQNVWPGCEVRELNSGHVAGYLVHHNVFTKAITDTFNRLIKKNLKVDPNEENEPSDKNNVDNDNHDKLSALRNGVLKFIPAFTLIKSIVLKG